jgi:chaperonin GroES
MKPLGNRIVIKQDDANTENKFGLIIPDTSIERPKTGTVEAVGPDVKTVQIGERVAFSEHAGSRVTIDDTEVLYIRETDVSFII